MSTPPDRVPVRLDDDAGFLGTNLGPENTGVEGAVVWIFASEFSRADADLGPRILVTPGRDLGVETLSASVAVTTTNPPRVLGSLPRHLEPKAVEWVERNRTALEEYWSGEMPTDQVLERLVRVG